MQNRAELIGVDNDSAAGFGPAVPTIFWHWIPGMVDKFHFGKCAARRYARAAVLMSSGKDTTGLEKR